MWHSSFVWVSSEGYTVMYFLIYIYFNFNSNLNRNPKHKVDRIVAHIAQKLKPSVLDVNKHIKNTCILPTGTIILHFIMQLLQ